MRNLIFKTVFATILTSLSLAPFAHADRQGGGGMMKVAFNAADHTSSEWVRFKGIEANKVSFEYAWTKNAKVGVEQVTIDRAEFTLRSSDLVTALLNSRKTLDWTSIQSTESN